MEKNIIENHCNFKKVQLKIELDDNNMLIHHQKVHQKETFLESIFLLLCLENGRFYNVFKIAMWNERQQQQQQQQQEQ